MLTARGPSILLPVVSVTQKASAGHGTACLPLIPALGKQRQVDLYEFKSNLVYKESSKTARAVTQRNSVLKNQNKKKEKKL